MLQRKAPWSEELSPNAKISELIRTLLDDEPNLQFAVASLIGFAALMAHQLPIEQRTELARFMRNRLEEIDVRWN
jgi:hypothetical protein